MKEDIELQRCRDLARREIRLQNRLTHEKDYLLLLENVAEAARPFESDFEVFEAPDGEMGVREISETLRHSYQDKLHEALYGLDVLVTLYKSRKKEE